jgi:hypothetical protein
LKEWHERRGMGRWISGKLISGKCIGKPKKVFNVPWKV